MIETAVAQIRFTLAVALGRPPSLRALDTLIASLQATRHEFGPLDPTAAATLNPPPPDEATRREVQLHRFREQAGRAARETAYYRPLFAGLGLDPAKLQWDDISRLPCTTKAAVQADPEAFMRRTARPVFRTTTTGTTGRPTHLYFSAFEMSLYAALVDHHEDYDG